MVELFFIFMPRGVSKTSATCFLTLFILASESESSRQSLFSIAKTVSTLLLNKDFFGTEKFIPSESTFSSIFVRVVELMFLMNVVE